MNLQLPELLNGFTAKTESPEGTIFTTINELDDKAIEVRIVIGKGGQTLAAWADALARVVSLALQSGLDINSILEELSGITSARVKRQSSGINIRSGPEAVACAIMAYLREKHKQNTVKLDLDDKMDNGSIDEGRD